MRGKRQKANEMNLAPYAKEYLKRGWSVAPADPNTKAPALNEWKKYQVQRMTETEIDACFRAGFNVGMFTGHVSGDLIGMDFDDKKLAALWKAAHPETLMFETGKGVRFLYTHQGSYPTKHLKEKGLDIDILGEGAFTVMPPSWHVEKKKNYRWLNEGSPILDYDGDFLEDLYAICSENEEYKKKLDAIDFFREHIDIDRLLQGVEEGGRDNAAIRVASWYRKGDLSPELVLKKLLIWNLKNHPPMSESEIDAKVKSAFKPSKPYFFFTRVPTSRDLEEQEELTPEVKTFLENPNLHEEILNILDIPICGERQLKDLLFHCGLSAGFTDKPFGVIIIDIFGSGKSFVARCVVEVFPKERVNQPTSISFKVLNYLAEDFKGKILRIDELFGEEEGMPDIRVWMTEGRLERWVTNADTGKAEKHLTGGCPVIITSTTEQVEEQYASRNWLAHTDTSRYQTKGVHHFQYVSDVVPENFSPESKQRLEFLTHTIRWLLQNAKPVLIPFNYSFATDPRSRRDKMKFQMLIKAVCNAHQLQRKIVTFNDKVYLIAEKADFENALQIAEPFLRSTTMTLDKNALALIDYLQTLKEGEVVTTKELLAALDIKNRMLHRKLEYLEQQGFIEFAAEPKRGTPSTYRLTEAGTKVSGVEVKITDDGQWLQDLYSHLNDPQTRFDINNALTRIWNATQEEEQRLCEAENDVKAVKASKLHEKAKEDAANGAMKIKKRDWEHSGD